jgi:hypothetical protein
MEFSLIDILLALAEKCGKTELVQHIKDLAGKTLDQLVPVPPEPEPEPDPAAEQAAQASELAELKAQVAQLRAAQASQPAPEPGTAVSQAPVTAPVEEETNAS